jgi:hypothetical protein
MRSLRIVGSGHACREKRPLAAILAPIELARRDLGQPSVNERQVSEAGEEEGIEELRCFPILLYRRRRSSGKSSNRSGGRADPTRSKAPVKT